MNTHKILLTISAIIALSMTAAFGANSVMQHEPDSQAGASTAAGSPAASDNKAVFVPERSESKKSDPAGQANVQGGTRHKYKRSAEGAGEKKNK